MSPLRAFLARPEWTACFDAAVDGASRFEVDVESLGAKTVLRVRGDVDISNLASWRCVLAEASNATAPDGVLVVDVDAAGFLGLCTFTALAVLSEVCRRRDIALRLVSAKPSIARIVALCQWENELPVFPTVSAAVDE